MMNSARSSSITLAVAFLIGCSTSNPPLTGPVRPAAPKIDYQGSTVSADGLTVEYDSRVDILFVIDDSQSMYNHQKKLSTNINRFVDLLAEVGALDLHVGYTVAHDSSRYGSIVPRTCPDGRINWEDAGSLRPLKGPAEFLPSDGRRFVTSSDPEFQRVLRDSLDPEINKDLVKPFVNPDPKNPGICPGGPELEELFTPLLGALTNTQIMESTNKGFRRDGALFVAVIVSDAKDASGITPESVALQVARATSAGASNSNKFRIFSVAFPPGMEIGTDTRLHETCRPDYAFQNSDLNSQGRVVTSWPRRHIIGPDENPLAVLAQLTEDENSDAQGHVLSICSDNYGEALAKFGTQIRNDALRDMTIELPRRWEISNNPNKHLKVFLGEKELVEEQPGQAPGTAQWRRNESDVSITLIAQNIDWTEQAGAKIRVKYVPAKDSNSTTRQN